MATSPKKKKAWMNLTAHHLPGMEKMELGKKYTVHAVIEPVDLSTGESEYPMHDEKGAEIPDPMRGRFKIHSLTKLDSTPAKGPKGKTARYSDNKKK